MADHDRGDPLYINAQAMLENNAGLAAVGLAMDLIMVVWWPTKAPFKWDESLLSKLLNKALPARGYTEETLRQHRDEASSFFTVLENGRWAPSPDFFSLVNGNPGSES